MKCVVLTYQIGKFDGKRSVCDIYTERFDKNNKTLSLDIYCISRLDTGIVNNDMKELS